MTQTPTPKIPTGQELYDAIMGHIEPELTSEGIKLLKATYRNETPQQLAVRKKRYELAFDRYEQAYQGYITTLHAQVTRFRRDSVSQVEVEDRSREEGVLNQLGQNFLAFS